MVPTSFRAKLYGLIWGELIGLDVCFIVYSSFSRRIFIKLVYSVLPVVPAAGYSPYGAISRA
jgi:hypothetical protein